MTMNSVLRQHLAALRALLLMTVVLGLAYPLTVTAVGQLGFAANADGSLVTLDGEVVGSALLGQLFADADGNPLPEWFQPRPSAAGDGYDPTSSSASNLGPENAELIALIVARRELVAEFNDVPPGDVPPDALTASGSGLDPDISRDYAYLQVDRVAAARDMDVEEVRRMVTESIVGRDLGFIGAPKVNVLLLNLSLQQASG